MAPQSLKMLKMLEMIGSTKKLQQWHASREATQVETNSHINLLIRCEAQCKDWPECNPLAYYTN